MNAFEATLAAAGQPGLYAQGLEAVQVNLGRRCNQACYHCHLECSSESEELMEWPVMELVLKLVESVRPALVDLTGGAPELNPYLPDFISLLRIRGHQVQLRTNLTVLLLPGQEDMVEFLREQRVSLVASLPCYTEASVRSQRGDGVFARSIEALRRLNSLGYGIDPELTLDLAYNPDGTALPQEQRLLEDDYRRQLGRQYGISFTSLRTLTNMPVGRFQLLLRRQNRDQEYLELLRRSFNSRALGDLPCRRQITVGWDGSVFDCDFNLALGLAVDHCTPSRLWSVNLDALTRRRIVTGNHCFACAAGASCWEKAA